MKITVFGLGYIGLPTAALLAQAGHQVDGFDVDPARRRWLRSGGTFAETEVAEVVSDALGSGRLEIVDSPSHSEAHIICVPTPTHNNRPDLSYVESATAQIVPLLRLGDLIVLESTVPPGTVKRIIVSAIQVAGKRAEDYHIVHCPERLIPGAIISELKNNARVIGGNSPSDAAVARDLYASFANGPIHATDCITAELVKVVENTFRDVNIAFANELALLCEELGVDVWETIRLANQHPRVSILTPGPGVGGHCIPVDPHFLSNANPFVTELIQTARRINQRMPDVMVRRVQMLVNRPPNEATVTLLGASYKPNVDDTRESPTERIDELLRDRGYRTRIYDPLARSFSRPLCKSLDDAVFESDAIVLVTQHDIFRSIDPEQIGRHMRERILISGGPGIDVEVWAAAGFDVYVLGAAASERRQPARSVSP